MCVCVRCGRAVSSYITGQPVPIQCAYHTDTHMHEKIKQIFFGQIKTRPSRIGERKRPSDINLVHHVCVEGAIVDVDGD